MFEESSNVVRVTSPSQQVQRFEVIRKFPFSSFRKRMSVIVQEEGKEGAIMFIKGADTVICERLGVTDQIEV
jgi:magnesium-transporting ATPase (P-type)